MTIQDEYALYTASDATPYLTVLSLGCNIEPREAFLHAAHTYLQQYLGTAIHCSSIYETEPWGFKSNSWFLNQVVAYSTTIPPEDILHHALNIESIMGRRRPTTLSHDARYVSRCIDIDILLMEDLIIQEPPPLIIPHPRITQRRFILIPLVELFPEGKHPISDISWKTLLAQCPDQGTVRLYTSSTL